MHTKREQFDGGTANSEVETKTGIRAAVQEIQADCTPRQRAVIGMIAMHVKYGVSLSSLLSSLSADLPRTPLEDRRRTRKFYWARVQQLADEIEEGKPFLDALKSYPKMLPETAELALRLQFEHDGGKDFSEAWLARAPLFQTRANFESSYVAIWFRMFLLTCVFIVVTSFFMIKVVPEFKSMLSEFGIPMPYIMQLTVTIMNAIVKVWFLPFLIFLCALPFYFRGVYRWVLSVNPLAWTKRRLPQAVRRRNVMAMVLDQKESVDVRKLKGLKQVQKDLCVSLGKLKKEEEPRARQIKLDSQPLKRQISKHEFQALKTADSDEARAWVLRKTALLKDRHLKDRERFWMRVVIGIVNILFGAVVVLLALSTFSLLVTLLEYLQ